MKSLALCLMKDTVLPRLVRMRTSLGPGGYRVDLNIAEIGRSLKNRNFLFNKTIAKRNLRDAMSKKLKNAKVSLWLNNFIISSSHYLILSKIYLSKMSAVPSTIRKTKTNVERKRVSIEIKERDIIQRPSEIRFLSTRRPARSKLQIVRPYRLSD